MARAKTAKKTTGAARATRTRAIEQQVAQVVAGEASVDAPRETPEQAAYERRSLDEAHRRLAEIRAQPLSDRKKAQEAFLEAMRESPKIVTERIGWLIDGDYGYGEMTLARRVLTSPRMNRAAALTHMIGALEWGVPEDGARAAWRKLSGPEQARLDAEVRRAIREAEETISEG